MAVPIYKLMLSVISSIFQEIMQRRFGSTHGRTPYLKKKIKIWWCSVIPKCLSQSTVSGVRVKTAKWQLPNICPAEKLIVVVKWLSHRPLVTVQQRFLNTSLVWSVWGETNGLHSISAQKQGALPKHIITQRARDCFWVRWGCRNNDRCQRPPHPAALDELWKFLTFKKTREKDFQLLKPYLPRRLRRLLCMFPSETKQYKKSPKESFSIKWPH